MDKKEAFTVLYSKEKRDVWSRFQIIENSIENSNWLYEYFDEIGQMLLNEKDYIKMRAFRIICRLAKWDNNKIDGVIDDLLNVLDSDKPTVIRMCLQTIDKLFQYKPNLINKVKTKLLTVDLKKYKDTMRPLIQHDIEMILHNICEKL